MPDCSIRSTALDSCSTHAAAMRCACAGSGLETERLSRTVSSGLSTLIIPTSGVRADGQLELVHDALGDRRGSGDVDVGLTRCWLSRLPV